MTVTAQWRIKRDKTTEEYRAISNRKSRAIFLQPHEKRGDTYCIVYFYTSQLEVFHNVNST
jgi:hypothetical protein